MQEADRAGMEQWLERVSTRRFWEELGPSLAIGGPPAAALTAVDEAGRAELWNELLTDGYFQLPPTVPLAQVARMREAVSALTELRIPAVFAYVYDDFWNLGAQLSGVLGALLGDGFRVLPSFWVWSLDAAAQERGWEPHRDNGYATLLPNGLPRSLTIWVPLVDATPANGCMYVVPAHRDVHYLQRDDSCDVVDVQEVRALPAEAGSVLGWNQALLHWGGRASPRARGPRVSFSFELQRGEDPPFSTPLLDPLRPPPFEARLGLIGQQILQYEHMHDMSAELVEMAKRLVERFPLA